MYKLEVGRIPLPTLYVCEDREDAALAKQHGLPYIIRPRGFDDEMIVKAVLFDTLRRKFPYINWWKQFGNEVCYEEIIVEVPGGHCEVDGTSRDEFMANPVADQATDYREFEGGAELGTFDYQKRPLNQYLDSTKLAAYVKVEELQDLGLMPVFLSNVATAIRRNLTNVLWTEGYNKKLRVPIGNFDAEPEVRNLIILDISGSIPRGVSSTMLTLIETLRDQANADLIITGSTSMYYKAGEALPEPQWIRDHCGFGNESTQFFDILDTYIRGKDWDNVISFGDDDCPWYCNGEFEMPGTRVGKLWNFHTKVKKRVTGYARWCTEFLDEEPEREDNCSWVRYMI